MRKQRLQRQQQLEAERQVAICVENLVRGVVRLDLQERWDAEQVQLCVSRLAARVCFEADPSNVGQQWRDESLCAPALSAHEYSPPSAYGSGRAMFPYGGIGLLDAQRRVAALLTANQVTMLLVLLLLVLLRVLRCPSCCCSC